MRRREGLWWCSHPGEEGPHLRNEWWHARHLIQTAYITSQWPFILNESFCVLHTIMSLLCVCADDDAGERKRGESESRRRLVFNHSLMSFETSLVRMVVISRLGLDFVLFSDCVVFILPPSSSSEIVLDYLEWAVQSVFPRQYFVKSYVL